MSNATCSEPLKFWLGQPGWLGTLIRVEWTNVHGVTESTMGRFDDSDNDISWDYATPPARYEDVCLEAARYGSEYAVSGSEYMGAETFAQMDAAVANRCFGCGVVQSSLDELSDEGKCMRCRTAKEAA